MTGDYVSGQKVVMVMGGYVGSQKVVVETGDIFILAKESRFIPPVAVVHRVVFYCCLSTIFSLCNYCVYLINNNNNQKNNNNNNNNNDYDDNKSTCICLIDK